MSLRSFFSTWSAVSHSKTRDFRFPCARDPFFHLVSGFFPPEMTYDVTGSSSGHVIALDQSGARKSTIRAHLTTIYIPNTKKVALAIGHWQLGFWACGTQCNALLE